MEAVSLNIKKIQIKEYRKPDYVSIYMIKNRCCHLPGSTKIKDIRLIRRIKHFN